VFEELSDSGLGFGIAYIVLVIDKINLRNLVLYGVEDDLGNTDLQYPQRAAGIQYPVSSMHTFKL
jgi:hypothetical protein